MNSIVNGNQNIHGNIKQDINAPTNAAAAPTDKMKNFLWIHVFSKTGRSRNIIIGIQPIAKSYLKNVKITAPIKAPIALPYGPNLSNFSFVASLKFIYNTPQ
ncbi:MAG: hypothetical protein WC974_08270 [Thermoplasmata archaeon]